MVRLPWTSKDEQRLIALRARGVSWQLIGRELRRSEASVIGRFAKLQKLIKPDRLTGPRKPILRLPLSCPLMLRAERAMADSEKLRAELHETRWQAAAHESRLLHLREQLADHRVADPLDAIAVSLNGSHPRMEERAS